VGRIAENAASSDGSLKPDRPLAAMFVTRKPDKSLIELRPGAYLAGCSSTERPLIFAARMKSFSDNPPIACVESSIQTLR